MRTALTPLVLLLALLMSCVVTGQTTFKNPVITGMNPDPSIVRVGDDFYLVTSTFEYFPGLPIYHSRDLVNWRLIGHALSRPSNCLLKGAQSSGGHYAPAFRYHNGTFYVTSTNYGGQGSQGAFYVTATDPTGPWSDPVWVGNWNVDPSIMFANDSMYWVSPDNQGNFMVGTFDPVNKRFIKPLRHIASGLGGSSPEGPHMYKINDFYYLSSAEGGTSYDHRQVVQRSRSPYGPFEVSPINPMASNMNVPNHPFQAIGHCDMFQIQDHSWWLVCLGIRPKGGRFHHLGRETFLAPVTWSPEGWPRVGATGVVNQEYTLPNLTPHPWPKEPVRDDFDSPNLSLHWNFVRNPYERDWSLTVRPGYLRLNGSAVSLKDQDSPAFIGRRQTAFDIAASARLSFTPTTPNEEAGLAIRGNDANHISLIITRFAGERVAMLRRVARSNDISTNYLTIGEGDITLRITATDLEYHFWVQEDGQPAIPIGTFPTYLLSTEVIGGFTGVFIGMYASGNGKVNANPADFHWFDFEENPALPFSWAAGEPNTQNQMVAPRIVSAEAPSFDSMRVAWRGVAQAASYTVHRYSNGQFTAVGTVQAPDTALVDAGLQGNTMYIYRVVAHNSLGSSHPSIAVSSWTLPKPGPFHGTPLQIPGRIEAEDYDLGPRGTAWSDTDNVNNGAELRGEGVDVERCTDTGGGYNVGWVNSGEWLVYTVDVTGSPVDIKIRAASPSGGSIRLELDGMEIARTNIAATGGWQTWATTTIPNIAIEKGTGKKLKITFLSGGFNLNWMDFTQANPSLSQSVRHDEGIYVFPNPTSNLLHIRSTGFEYSSISIIDLTGKNLHSQAMVFRPENTVSLSLPNGQYILSLHNSSKGQSRVSRFTVAM